MISRLGLRSSKLALPSSRRAIINTPTRLGLTRTYAPGVTTKTTIYDQTNGRTIQLADPDHPELADYKNPEFVLKQTLDPYAKYDDPQNRRNLNDPMHIDEDMLDMWSPDYYDYVADSVALKHNAIFFGSIAGIAAIIYYFELYPEKPAMIRSFPYNGLADALGATSKENAPFYQNKPDLTAEQELGVLPADNDITQNKQLYEKENADFIKSGTA
ncbi:hypothetical protein Cantr_04285 [Candida viswanathii]|uniref:Uncharacterized protein n=1 Tax=Candida viswanathii TaxID=5486 RepID=A0A367XP56_9ASCO|nr:hypothetical protein Cantr_04285 [Candida viswanathii]